MQHVRELLHYRHAAKTYGVGTWFAYRGHPAGDPYDRNPAEIWHFLAAADAMEAVILKEMYPPPKP